MLRDLFSLFPAYAGVILSTKSPFCRRPSFPRIRGGDPWTKSPKLVSAVLFPASAGVILLKDAAHGHWASFPRIRGGDPDHAGQFFTPYAFSPHTRGLPKDPSQGFA